MYQSDMVIHAYNASIWETEAGSSGVQGHLQLHGEFKRWVSENCKGTKPTHGSQVWAAHPQF